MTAAPPVEQTPELCDAHVQARDEHRKRFETLAARLALRGFQMHRQADGALLITRWSLSRTCSGLDEAEAFALQAGCGTDA